MEESFIEKSQLLIKLKKYDKAIELLKRGLQNDIENSIYYDLLGRCYFHLKDFSTCQKYYQKANQLDPTNAMSWLRLAELNLQMKRLDEAERCTKNCQEINPNIPDIHYLFAAIYFEKRKYRVAIIECDKALKLYPEHKNSLELKGIALTILNQVDEAAEVNKNALNMNPNSEKALTNYGMNELWKGNIEKAESIFVAVLERDPTNLSALAGYKTAVRGRNRLQRILMKMEIHISQNPSIIVLYSISIILIAFFVFIFKIQDSSEPFGCLILEFLLFYFITLFFPLKILPQFSVLTLMKDKIGKKIITKRRKYSGIISLVLFLLGILAIIYSFVSNGIRPFFGMLLMMIGILIVDFGYNHISRNDLKLMSVLVIVYFIIGLLTLFPTSILLIFQVTFFFMTLIYPSVMSRIVMKR